MVHNTKKLLNNIGEFKDEGAQVGKSYLVISVPKSIFTVNLMGKNVPVCNVN